MKPKLKRSAATAKPAPPPHVQAMIAPLRAIYADNPVEAQVVRDAEVEINAAFERLLDGFRHQVLTVLMRTTQTILTQRLCITAAPSVSTVLPGPTVLVATPTAPTAALVAVNGGWRKRRPVKPEGPGRQQAASQEEKAKLRSLLITIRSGMNWSQSELAARLGAAEFTVGGWERGAAFPMPSTHEKILALAKELGVSSS